MLPLPATPAPLATAAFADPPAATLIAEARAVLTGQYYFIVIVDSNSIQLVACVFFYRLCIITIIVSFYLPATPAATPSRFYGRVPPPARPGK